MLMVVLWREECERLIVHKDVNGVLPINLVYLYSF